jgi:hypothetical protein
VGLQWPEGFHGARPRTAHLMAGFDPLRTMASDEIRCPMRQRFEPRRNWGCLVAALLGVPLLFIIFGAGMIGGGGCEGRESPCTGDYSRMWIGLGVVLATSLSIAWGFNRVVERFNSRRFRDKE